jgi:alginate O-acetyltransferase complex protein AlgI
MWKFDFYYSFPFWLSFAAVVLISRLLSFSPKWKRFSLLIFSFLFLLAIPRFHLYDLLVLLTTTVIAYSVTYILCKRAGAGDPWKRKWWAALGILVVISILAFFKYHFIQDFIFARVSFVKQRPADYVFLLGVSYFSFKMLHTIIEAYKLKITNLNFLNYINYILFFPSFISGPINRFNHFAQQLDDESPRIFWNDFKSGLERIVHGLFKKFVIVQILFPYIQIFSGEASSISQLPFHRIALGLYAYALYFYFDFSAYSDLAIGCGRILGIALPENFNNPFLRRNIRELWANWHMSLTQWLIDYVYWPLVRKFRNLNYFRTHPLQLSVVAMTITFLACGMWHGETVNFILWGAYHGIGISIVTVYQRIKYRIKLAFMRKYFASRFSKTVGAFMTFNFFALGLSLFVGNLDIFKIVISKIFSFL